MLALTRGFKRAGSNGGMWPPAAPACGPARAAQHTASAAAHAADCTSAASTKWCLQTPARCLALRLSHRHRFDVPHRSDLPIALHLKSIMQGKRR